MNTDLLTEARALLTRITAEGIQVKPRQVVSYLRRECMDITRPYSLWALAVPKHRRAVKLSVYRLSVDLARDMEEDVLRVFVPLICGLSEGVNYE